MSVTSNLVPGGVIFPFGGATAPKGWLLCDGTAYSRPVANGGANDTYKELYSAIGTTYGVGDGATTFNVPDFRDKFPIGKGSTYSTLGSAGGTTTISSNHLPTHSHASGTLVNSTSAVTGTLNNQSANHSHTAAMIAGANVGNGTYARVDVLANTAYATAAESGTILLPGTVGLNTRGNDTSYRLTLTSNAQDTNHTHTVNSMSAAAQAISGSTGNNTTTATAFIPPYQVVNHIIKY
jgi:microcystin-dependent protein